MASSRMTFSNSRSISTSTTATPSSTSHVADAADLDAGHAHGLTLPGLDRLGVRELDLHALRLVLDQREAEALVGQDVAAHHYGDHEQPQDGEEGGEM